MFHIPQSFVLSGQITPKPDAYSNSDNIQWKNMQKFTTMKRG